MHDIITLQIVGWPPLVKAAFNGNVGIVAALLSSGANVNQANHDGWFPLHYAAYLGHDGVVALLLDNGADLYLANNDGQKPIDVAKDQKIKDMLIAHTTKNQTGQVTDSKVVDEAQWFQAATKGDLAVIQQGINDKIDVNCRDSDGRTALIGAAFYGHIFLVEYLILQHADVNIPSVSANDTLLHHHITTNPTC